VDDDKGSGSKQEIVTDRDANSEILFGTIVDSAARLLNCREVAMLGGDDARRRFDASAASALQARGGALELSDEAIEALGSFADAIERLFDVRAGDESSVELSEARRRALVAIDRWQRNFRLTEQLVNIGSWHLDVTTGLVDWSPQTFAIFGRSTDEGAPDLESLFNYYSTRDREVLMQAVDRAIGTGESFDLETDIVTAGGLKRRVRNVGETLFADGEPVGLFGVCQDVTERYFVEQALERSAKIDELTQIPNRAALNARLDELIADRVSAAPGLVLMMIDLDNFKKLNDTYGHPAGDFVLKAMADKLSDHAARLGFTARLGGDEFVLVVTNELAMRDIRGLLADLLFDLRVDYGGDRGVIRVAATLGACWLDGDVPTRAELLKRADLALYSAKALGKGRAIVSGDMRPILPADQQPELRAAG